MTDFNIFAQAIANHSYLYLDHDGEKLPFGRVDEIQVERTPYGGSATLRASLIGPADLCSYCMPVTSLAINNFISLASAPCPSFEPEEPEPEVETSSASYVTPKVRKWISNDPATAVLWGDGTRTVAKVHPEDEFDPIVGLLTCCLRKALRNRTVGPYEFLVFVAAKVLRTRKRMRDFATALSMAAEALGEEESDA